ncbi:MAG: hypothetical protein SF028_06590 [Candidatus Sumerlaeia bacterium]|nr:hypothetical protein [Candidatus Sumerlaeia bacterium]
MAEPTWSELFPGIHACAIGAEGAAVLYVACEARRTEWIPRTHDTSVPGRAGMVATVFEFEGGLFRLEEERADGAGWLYVAEPLAEGVRAPHKVLLTAEALLEEEMARQEREKETTRSEAAGWYDWALGVLPGGAQELLAERLHFDTARATARSGMVEFTLGLTLGAIAIARLFAAGLGAGDAASPPGPVELLVLALMVAEGAGRMMHGKHAERAFGTLPLEALWRLGAFAVKALGR